MLLEIVSIEVAEAAHWRQQTSLSHLPFIFTEHINKYLQE